MEPRRALEGEIVRIVARVTRLPESEIRSDADLFEELGVDSLTVLQVVAALEKRFGVTIPDTEVSTHRRLSQIVARMATLTASRGDSG